MAVTYRTLGPWGAGKGANLQPSEVDGNFYELAQAIVDIQNNPEQPNGIESITVSGTQMTIYLTDGTVMGPFTLPVLTFRWRGEFEPGVPYAILDVFTFSSGNTHLAPGAEASYGIFMVQIAGMWGGFNPDLLVDGLPVYLQLFGSVDTLLSTLGDVNVTEPLSQDDVLVWDAGTEKWINATLGDMAWQEQDNVYITGGQIHGMGMPTAPGDVANKAYVDALPLGMSIPTATIMSNMVGGSGPALPNTLSDILDYCLVTTVRGTLLFRGSAGWTALTPGTSGLFLRTSGPGADVTWAPGGAGISSITAGAGIDTTPDTIVGTGTVALAAVADNSLLANASGVSAAPTATTLTTFLDHVASSTRGSILTRAGSGWVALAPGTSGYYLQTQGATADPVWSSPSGSGTVTSISAGTGISTGGAPITGAGTVSLAAIATSSVLANISGSSAAPVPATVSALFDSVFGATQGAVLYRNASTWVMLTPGTSGQVLTTGGAAANPAWANAPAGAPIANQRILANISGGTAAAIANTLSDILDNILGSSRGMLVYRGASGWAALLAGTSGQVLTTSGTAGDPHWAAAAGGGASITVSDTAPASPSPGDAWWDSVGGQLYIRVDDGTSVQWVPASNQPGPAGSANMSGMVAGQIPIAASATTVTSSTSDLVISGGNVGIGTTGPTSKLHVSGPILTDGTAGGYVVGGRTGTGSSMLYRDAGVTSFWDSVAANVLSYTNAGNVGIGTATPGYKFHVVGPATAGTWNTSIAGGPAGSDSTTFMVVFTDASASLTFIGGIARNGTGIAYGTSSDERLKTDITDSERGLDALLALKVSDYKMGETAQQGLLAQDVAQIYPEAVHEGGDDPNMEPWMIDYGRLTPLLIKAIQDLAKEVDGLRAQLAPKEAQP